MDSFLFAMLKIHKYRGILANGAVVLAKRNESIYGIVYLGLYIRRVGTCPTAQYTRDRDIFFDSRTHWKKIFKKNVLSLRS